MLCRCVRVAFATMLQGSKKPGRVKISRETRYRGRCEHPCWSFQTARNMWRRIRRRRSMSGDNGGGVLSIPQSRSLADASLPLQAVQEYTLLIDLLPTRSLPAATELHEAARSCTKL
jgi:hypothetical protein